jgi:hypothetical protein
MNLEQIMRRLDRLELAVFTLLNQYYSGDRLKQLWPELPAPEPSEVSLQIAARVWCDHEMQRTQMDSAAAKAIACILDDVRKNVSKTDPPADASPKVAPVRRWRQPGTTTVIRQKNKPSSSWYEVNEDWEPITDPAPTEVRFERPTTADMKQVELSYKEMMDKLDAAKSRMKALEARPDYKAAWDSAKELLETSRGLQISDAQIDYTLALEPKEPA